jgi:hypothetical protein
LNREYVLDADPRREKIRRAIEINKARNVAIEHGQCYSKYVVVLDGDCMFDAAGWDVVQEEMLLGGSQHLSIPHVRSRIGALSAPGQKLAEPMLAFRHDSRIRFDNAIPFGEGDKLRLLYALGHDQIPGGGHCSVVGDATKIVGRVHHLATGEDDTETDNALRSKLRSESLDKLLYRISTEMPIRTIGHNRFYEQVDGFFDFSGPYSGVALDAPDGAHMVEVGAWKGKSIIYLATEMKGYGKRARIDAVDTWDGGTDSVLLDAIAAMGGANVLFETFLHNIKNSGVGHMIHPVQMRSVDAAKLYGDNSLDFVWIDAGHTYRDILDDLEAWYPKVKIGGLIAGHDYVPEHPVSWAGVVRAVSEFFKGKPLEIQPTGRCWKSVKYETNCPISRQRRWV